MPQLKFERHVPYSPAQMLGLVADLASYPRFVPNCSDMELRAEPGGTQLARMAIRFGPINQSYTSRVTVDEKQGIVAAQALDGPFSHLDSCWTFQPEGAGTDVRFEIDFGLSNPLIAAVAEPAFAAKQTEILDAFIAEAKRRFG